MSKIYVLYHASCKDGTASKYAAWAKYRSGATYIAVNYGQPVPEMEPESEVYILDFAYPKDVLEALQDVHKSVVVLDHHKTSEEALRGVKGCQFDMHRSGCVMAWNYFHPGVPVPDLLQDVMDRDLWLFKRPNSKSIHHALDLLDGNMASWDTIVKSPELYRATVEVGNTLLQKEYLAVLSYVKGKIKIINFKDFKVGITNSSDLASEIGNAICESPAMKTRVDFAIVYCITKDNDVLLSFRSRPDFDVSEVAKTLGGGGHKCASGAKVSLEVLSKILREQYLIKGWVVKSKGSEPDSKWEVSSVDVNTGKPTVFSTEKLAYRHIGKNEKVSLKGYEYKPFPFYEDDV